LTNPLTMRYILRMDNTTKSLFAGALLGRILGIALVLLIGFGTAHCEVPSTNRHSNEFGAVIEYTNPFMYNFGIITDAAVIRTDKRIATNLKFQPYGTFALYTEQVMLCGLPTDELINKASGPVILVYKRQANAAVQGVACHNLEGVFSVGAQ
jgi:hypothetical protein